jgi:O-antigen/teichoic acid export membrane protein
LIRAHPAKDVKRKPVGPLGIVVRVTLGFLILDAFLLVSAALFLDRPWLVLFAAALGALCVAVVALQRRFQRRWNEVGIATRELRGEVEDLSQALGTRPPNPRDS